MDLNESDVRAILEKRDQSARSSTLKSVSKTVGTTPTEQTLDVRAPKSTDFGIVDLTPSKSPPHSLGDRVRAISNISLSGKRRSFAPKLPASLIDSTRLKGDIGIALHQGEPVFGQTSKASSFQFSDPLTFHPSYPWWERQSWSIRWQGGSFKDNASYLDGDTGRMGARLWAQNLNASDASGFDLLRRNGFLFPYTMPFKGTPVVQTTLRADFCEHSIWTKDEWGVSNCGIFTTESVECGFLWKWEDEVLQGASSTSLVQPLYNVTNSFSTFGSNGKAVLATPGDKRNFELFPKQEIPAGAQVWIYLGIANRVIANLDDISASVWIDSSWKVPEVTITAIAF